MPWTKPRLAKIYEALGAVADDRVELNESKNEAKVFSSSGSKYYTVSWNDDFSQMMANDNAAYYVGELSYPMIAVLLVKGKVSFNSEIISKLKNIKWKDINKKFKNDYEKSVAFVLSELESTGVNTNDIQTEAVRIHNNICPLDIDLFGKRRMPPLGY